jgi:hypothetical protein
MSRWGRAGGRYKFLLAAVMPVAALAVAACGSNSSSTPAHSAATTTPALTTAQGASICNDLQTWWNAVYNEDTPRFDGTMQADEQEAQRTQLGNDLSTLDNDLQSENSAAFDPGPPGDPQDMQILEQDCAAYGVTVSQPGS